MAKLKERGSKALHIRETIAHLAARLIAVDGVKDFALAKRKAAKQAGCDETQNLPTNAEVEQALKSYRDLYYPIEHRNLLIALRREALLAMELLKDFSPYLVGSVLSGAAGRYSDINLQLYTDNAKEVELFLLNHHIDYRLEPLPSDRATLALSLYTNDVQVSLSVYNTDDLRRQAPRHDAEVLERARPDQVARLLADNELEASLSGLPISTPQL